jgi:hypothetical protein
MKKFLFLLVCLGVNGLQAQKYGFQFLQGVSKPVVQFSAVGEKLAYQSSFTNDTRAGLWFGDLNNVSFSVLLGYANVSANHTNPDFITTMGYSSFLMDMPVRYSIKESVIKSFSIGPTLGILANSSQTVNNLAINTKNDFSPTTLSISSELSFKGFQTEGLNIAPYLGYRMMLNSADADNDKLHLNAINLGLRIDLTKQEDVKK